MTGLWDIPPPPQIGDASEDITFTSVGRALTRWEEFEVVFASLFSALVATEDNNAAAIRARVKRVAKSAGRERPAPAQTGERYASLNSISDTTRSCGSIKLLIRYRRRPSCSGSTALISYAPTAA